ncbi:MAG: hypothetical protein ABIV26_00645 [Candidatus Limnocylindrales bacterium]
MAADDDEINLLAAGRIDDRIAGVAFPDQEADANVALPTPSHEFLGSSLAGSPNLVETLSEPVTREAEGCRVDDADEKQRGAEVVREVEGLQGRALGRRREVGRQEDSRQATARHARLSNGVE